MSAHAHVFMFIFVRVFLCVCVLNAQMIGEDEYTMYRTNQFSTKAFFLYGLEGSRCHEHR